MRDNIKSVPYDCPIDVDKMKGRMTIILTDVKTGKQEVIEESNMMTDAMKEYFRNCGFMNSANLNKDNLVETLLGGIIGLDTALDEDATLLHVPAGVEMVFNGAVGTTNTGTTPSELGTCSTAVVSGEPDTGWQSNGDYKITIDYTTEQGNCKTGKQICCVCLCNKNYGHAGEGNAKSLVSYSTKSNIADITGSTSDAVYSGIPGHVFCIEFGSSTCMSFNIEEVEEEQEGETVTVKKGFLRTYRLPISKLNLKGTRTAPILLVEEEITIDSDLADAAILQYQPIEGQDMAELLIWNAPKASSGSPTPTWGSGFTQYLWTLTAEGTLTKTTVTNTSGLTLNGLGPAYFAGNYCYFPETYSQQHTGHYYYDQYVNTNKIIVWNRSTNAMSIIEHTFGYAYPIGEAVTLTDYFANCATVGWVLHHCTDDGKIYLLGSTNSLYSQGFVVDVIKDAAWPHNANGNNVGRLYDTWGLDGEDLIQTLIRTTGLQMYRDQSYIATINNLAEPVAKDNSKPMKAVYRISLNEEEESKA